MVRKRSEKDLWKNAYTDKSSEQSEDKDKENQDNTFKNNRQ